MKTEDEKLKKIFSKNFEQQRIDNPDFELMWEEAVKNNKEKVRLIWRIAASVALLIAVGVVIILNRQNNDADMTMQIASWNEPTKSLMLPQTGEQLTGLTNWTSPTDFLLPANNQHIK